MCLRLQIRSVHLHVFIGLALVVSLIVFTYEGAYIKQKYSSGFKASAGKKSFLSLVVDGKRSMVRY